MIKLRYNELSKPPFQKALNKLANVQMRSPEAFKIKHMMKDVQAGLDEMKDAFTKDILAVYSQGGKGEVGPEPGTPSQEADLPFAAVAGKEAAAKEALENFGKREVTVKSKKLTGEFLLSVAEWSVAELSALDPVLTDLVVVE